MTLFLSVIVSIPMVLLKAGEADSIVGITSVVFMFLPLISTLITKRVSVPVMVERNRKTNFKAQEKQAEEVNINFRAANAADSVELQVTGNNSHGKKPPFSKG